MNIIFKNFQNFIDYKSINVAKKTLRNYYTVSKNLRTFLICNKQFKTIADINSIKFMREFNTYLFTNFGKYHCKRHLLTVKSFIIFLINDEIITVNKVRDYTPLLPAKENELISLSIKELYLIERLNTDSERLSKVKDLFLIQCYTGLAYADLIKLNYDMLEIIDNKHYLTGTRTKSKINFYIPLTDKSINLLSKYNFDLPKLSNQKYNLYLKELAKLAQVKINLTTHVGRKTCGQLFLNFGYSIEAVSRILGHSDIKTTQMYYARSSFELVHKENLKIAI